MVRAGVVSHPEQWSHGGYSEIQHPRRKNILIDYEALSRLSGFDNFESFQSAHRRWVQSALSDNETKRVDCWTQSIATGSQSFVETVKRQMRSIAIGRCVRKKVEGFEFRESQSPYKGFFDTKRAIYKEKTYGFGMNKNKKGYRKVSLDRPAISRLLIQGALGLMGNNGNRDGRHS